MQPCAVCGGVTVNAAGYCARCGTFRGPAAAGQATSGPALTANRTRVFAVALVALSVILVALVAAIVVVVIVRDDDRGTAPIAAGGGPSAAHSGTPDAGQIDPCVVGDWQVTAHQEQVDPGMPGVDKVTFSGAGAQVRLSADGTGVTDYGDATRFEGRAADQTIRLEVRGTITYRFTTADGSISLRDMSSNATSTSFLDGKQYGSEQVFRADGSPASYQCSGDTLVETTAWYETRLTRLG